MRHTNIWSDIAPLTGFLLAMGVALALPGEGLADAAEQTPKGIYAIIDGEEISHEEFDGFVSRYMRSKYYHGANAQTLAKARREATEALIEQRLLAHEAERRGLAGDPVAVDAQLTEYEARYSGSEAWPEIRELWPAVRAKLLEETKVAELKASIREIPDPDDAVLREYYARNLNLFTEPAKKDVSVILLGVAATAERSEWSKARDKAGEIYATLQTGSDFSDLAREHSTHASAGAGGRLGLLHIGQLSKPAQEAVNQLGAGMVTEPVRILDGYALFKLHGQFPEQVHEFSAVRDRALQLYKREHAERKWNDFMAKLRAGASIEFNVSN